MVQKAMMPRPFSTKCILREKNTFKTWRPYKRWCNFKALNVSLWWPLSTSLGISRFNTQVFVIIYIHHALIYNPFSLFIAIAFLLHLLVNFKFQVKLSPNHLYSKTRTLIIMKTTIISKVEQKKLWKKHNKYDASKFYKQCTFH